MFNKEYLQKRLEELTQMEKQFWAEINAVLGAKNECLKMLEELNKSTAPEDVDEPEIVTDAKGKSWMNK